MAPMGTKPTTQVSWGLADGKAMPTQRATQRATCVTTISFGPITIPIKVLTGSRRVRADFKQLHGKDGGRLQQGYTCATCSEPVPYADQVKGFEHTKGQFLVLDPTEIKALEIPGKSIVIDHFCPAGQIDSSREAGDVSLIIPDQGAESTYQLFQKAMVKDKTVGIGRFTSRGKSVLVCLRPAADGGIVMVPLFHADEIRDFGEIETGAELKPAKEAFGLIREFMGTMSRDFDASEHPDLYRAAVSELVAAKLKGKSPRVVTVTEHRGASQPVIDIVAALKDSLEEEAQKAAARSRRPAGQHNSRRLPDTKPTAKRKSKSNGRAARA